MSKLERLSKRKHLNQFILKVPASHDWEAFMATPAPLDDEPDRTYQDIFDGIQFQVVQDTMVGTQEFNSKRLCLCMAYINNGDLQSLLSADFPDFSISAFEGTKVIQNRVLSHLLPEIEVTQDENGDDVYTEVPITDCTGKLCTISGHSWKY